MNKTQYTIYWIVDNEPQFKQTPDMSYALAWMEYLRKNPKFSAITFCSENADQVGKPGVDAVVNGVLPDGHKYDYMKRREQ